MSLARAIATVGGLTLLSRVAGFARDVLTAALVGAGPIADAFFVALKLPNLFRRVFAEGAFSVSFVPLFAGTLEGEGRGAARRFAEEALALMILVLLPMTLIMVAAMPQVMVVLAPGFVDDPVRFEAAVEMARITFPYLMLISLVALLGGILNSIDRFAPFAAAPIAFNLSVIAALLLAGGWTETRGHAMAYGVAVAGIVQLVWLIMICRKEGLAPRLRWPRLTAKTKRLLRLMGPGVLGAGAMQINLFIDIVLASMLPAGAISYLYYADRLNQLPLGVIGIAIGTALLPRLSRQVKAGDPDGQRESLSRGLEFSLMLGLPAAAALIVVPAPVIAVLFERGAFGAEETAATAAALMAYAVGIPAYLLIKVLNVAFFAHEDTVTPVKAAIVMTVCNIALAIALIGLLGHVGIALATGITAWVNVGLLVVALRRRGQFDLDQRIRRRAPRLVVASLVMVAGLWGVFIGLQPLLEDETLAMRALGLSALVGAGAGLYFVAGQLLGAVRLQDVRALLRRGDAREAP